MQQRPRAPDRGSIYGDNRGPNRVLTLRFLRKVRLGRAKCTEGKMLASIALRAVDEISIVSFAWRVGVRHTSDTLAKERRNCFEFTSGTRYSPVTPSRRGSMHFGAPYDDVCPIIFANTVPGRLVCSPQMILQARWRARLRSRGRLFTFIILGLRVLCPAPMEWLLALCSLSSQVDGSTSERTVGRL